jgi:hypothetical protein
MTISNHAWGRSAGYCRLSISVPNTQIQGGRAVELSLIFRNDSQNEVIFPRISNWFDYKYNIVYEDNQAVPLTKFGEIYIRTLSSGSFAFKTIFPGNETNTEVLINRLYDMSLPGHYTLEAFKEIPNPTGDGFIKVISNIVAIDIED